MKKLARIFHCQNELKTSVKNRGWLDSKNLLTSQVDFMGVITQMNITKWGQDCRKSQQSPVNRVHTKECKEEPHFVCEEQYMHPQYTQQSTTNT